MSEVIFLRFIFEGMILAIFEINKKLEETLWEY